MKKNIVGGLLIMCFLAMLGEGVSSCTKDKDDNESSSGGVVGTWSGKDGKDQLTLNFKKGGTGTWTARYYDSYYGTETDRGSFEWEMEGKNEGWIYIEDYSSSGKYTYSLFFEIEGKNMYLYEDEKDFIMMLTKQ